MFLRIFRLFAIKIPKSELTLNFSRSSGPGGQNVNKVNSKADVRFNVDEATWIDTEVKERLKELYPQHINKEGELIVVSQKHREQRSNEIDALQKLQNMVDRAAEPKKEREYKEYEETDEQKKERIKVKRMRSEIKSKRQGRYEF